MAEKIKSIFGPYAENMQAMIDNSLELFKPVWWKNYFDWAPTTTSLSFSTAIGRSRIEAAASVVDRNSSAPLRSRAQLERLTGNVPAIKEAFKMTEEDYRNYLTIQAMSLSDGAKKAQMLDLMFGDIKKASEAPQKRLDIMVLQALSTGKVSINATNNPDGIVTGDIDLLMPTDNFKKVVEKWSVSADATPITDIKTIVEAAEAKGITFEKMLMSRNTFWKLQKCDETIKMLGGFFRLKTTEKIAATQSQVNEFLSAHGFPVIELVNVTVGIEKDGAISTLKPWNDTSVTFVPSGKLGIIHNAFSIEQMKPVQNVSYAVNDKVLVSKYLKNDPWGEFTGCELNAFPGVEAIDTMFILDVETKA